MPPVSLAMSEPVPIAIPRSAAASEGVVDAVAYHGHFVHSCNSDSLAGVHFAEFGLLLELR